MKEGTKIKLASVIFGLFALMAAIAIGGRWYQQFYAVGPYRDSYSAYVIEKQTIRMETSDGGLFARVLIVEDLNGNRFKVKVSENVYQQAKPGTFIEKKANDPEPFLGQ